MARPHPGPGLELDEQLCFALYRASRAITARYRPLLEGLGLTYPQYLVMLVLWQQGDPAGVGELGRRLSLDSGTLSPLLKRLESAGLVQRRRRRDDERAVDVHLTPRGRRLRERAVAIPGQICAASGLTVPEATRLGEELHGLADRVSEDLRSAS